jgi:flagellar assembly protein FliH
MGLIKANNAPVGVAPFSMRDIEDAARKMLLRARRQAEEFLGAAQVEAEGLKKAAKAEGFSEGRREGLAKGLEEGHKAGQDQALAEHRAKLTELVGGLGAVLAELDLSRRALEAEALREVVELAVAIARRVTKRQAVIDPGVLEANLVEVMKLAVHASDVRVAVCPSEKAMLEGVLPRLQAQWPATEHVELVADPELTPGGVRVFTRGGEIDGALDEQLDRIVMELLPAAAGAG